MLLTSSCVHNMRVRSHFLDHSKNTQWTIYLIFLDRKTKVILKSDINIDLSLVLFQIQQINVTKKGETFQTCNRKFKKAEQRSHGYYQESLGKFLGKKKLLILQEKEENFTKTHQKRGYEV